MIISQTDAQPAGAAANGGSGQPEPAAKPRKPIMDRLSLGLWRSPPTVSAIRLSGVIGMGGSVLRSGLTLHDVAPLLDRLFAPRHQAAVALIINSPGGSPAQSSLIAERIRALAQERSVKVLTFVEDAAASGGYWLACAGDEIYADATSIVGSIGVISASFGFQDLIQRFGIERRLYTAGDRKSLLDPFQPEKEADVARLKAIQQHIHQCFVAYVRNRRGDRLKGTEDELFSGEFWAGERAVQLGLIDGIGSIRTLLRARYGERVRVRVVSADRGWLRRRTGIDGIQSLGAGVVPETLGFLEERACWARYGL